MPTIDWLKKEFSYGYRSGDVLAPVPDDHRRSEELRCGADYREIFLGAVLPRIPTNATIMELGPGGGSWSRAFLHASPDCKLVTVDFQDVTQWLEPQAWNGRVTCHKVEDASFSVVEPASVDLFFSFGVLCHNNSGNIATILSNSLSRMKPGGIAIHQYGDWRKLEHFGWEAGGVPKDFRDLPDEDIWWPRNDGATMERLARAAGWEVVEVDLGLIRRDGMILLRAPDSKPIGSVSRGETPEQQVDAMVREGLALLERDRVDEAATVSDRILAGGLLREGAHMLAAAVRFRQGRSTEGIESLRRETVAFPGNRDARETLDELLREASGSASAETAGTSGRPPILLNLGCGSRHHPAWKNYDLRPSDPNVLPLDARLRLDHATGSVDALYHSHMLEHLGRQEARDFLAECHRVLRAGGTIRIAVPDLEGIARAYLRELEAAIAGDREASVRREWMVLELLDQVGRHRSGGEMMEWWRRAPVPAEEFIYERVGGEARQAIRAAQADTTRLPRREPPREPADPREIGEFRLSGEVHRWMYDRVSLAEILVEAGFRSPRKVGATESAIPGFASCALDTEADGEVRKPDSLYMEATK